MSSKDMSQAARDAGKSGKISGGISGGGEGGRGSIGGGGSGSIGMPLYQSSNGQHSFGLGASGRTSGSYSSGHGVNRPGTSWSAGAGYSYRW